MKNDKIRIGLVGENEFDSKSMKNLFQDLFKEKVIFSIVGHLKGDQVNSGKLERILRVEEEFHDIFIIIRDLDGFESEKEKVQARQHWFEKINQSINQKGIFLLHIQSIESLILADIHAFNHWANVNLKYDKNPMFEPKPALFLERHSNQKYKKSDNPEIFKVLNINLLKQNHKGFSSFIKRLENQIK